MKDWKSTAAGIATAFFGFVLFSPDFFHAVPWLVALAKYGMVGGLAVFGVVAKDAVTKS